MYLFLLIVFRAWTAALVRLGGFGLIIRGSLKVLDGEWESALKDPLGKHNNAFYDNATFDISQRHTTHFIIRPNDMYGRMACPYRTLSAPA